LRCAPTANAKVNLEPVGPLGEDDVALASQVADPSLMVLLPEAHLLVQKLARDARRRTQPKVVPLARRATTNPTQGSATCRWQEASDASAGRSPGPCVPRSAWAGRTCPALVRSTHDTAARQSSNPYPPNRSEF